MNTFFVADTHFNHARILIHEARPFSNIDEMNETLIFNWNAVVNPKDLVYHLGDFGFNNVEPVLKRLNGKKILIIGNHDEPSTKAKIRPYFERQEKLLDIRITEPRLGLRKQVIVLCHYAMRVWPGSRYGAWHLYGHSHGNLPSVGKSMDVGIDATELWRPIYLEEVATAMATRCENLDGRSSE